MVLGVMGVSEISASYLSRASHIALRTSLLTFGIDCSFAFSIMSALISLGLV